MHMNTSEFIGRAIERHGDRYDYSKAVYVNPREKVCIICREHGEFWQKPYNHLSGQGCGRCRYDYLSGRYKKSLGQWISECTAVHGGKYDYSKSEYKTCQDKVCIICPEHGEFWQRALAHSQGQGCPYCSGNARKDSLSFSEAARSVHGDVYDYSMVNYVNNSTKVEIVCPKHGAFWQSPSKHLKGHGCPKCGGSVRSDSITFADRAAIVHGGKYGYSEVDYVNAHTKAGITCHEHGIFLQNPSDHLQGKGCPSCSHSISNAEREICAFLYRFFPEEDISVRDRTVLSGGKELDIFIPKLGLAIEYNGLIWHSEKFNKGKNYHLDKLVECNGKGIKLIQVFEDEWLERKDIVLSKIRHIIGKDCGVVVPARKCVITEVPKGEAHAFLDANHIQGSAGATVFVGAYHLSDLVAVMGFRRVGEEWELVRFATLDGIRCCGIGSRLFRRFVREFAPEKVKSFADRRWTTDKDSNLYTKLGFCLTEVLPPDYRYVNGQNREHKFGYRKSRLHKKYGFPMELTERQMTERLGVYRIYDCGLLRYEWTRKKTATD